MLQALPWLVLAGFGVRLAWVDAREHRLPNRQVAALTVAFLVTITSVSWADDHLETLLRAVLGGLVLAGVFLAAALVSPRSLGMGDVKLAFTIGAALAWLGWGWLWWGCLLAFMAAAGWGLVRAVGVGDRGPIALGPFLIAAPLGCAVLESLI